MIINSCPVSLPSEIDQPQPLTLGMLLMMIIRRLAPNPGHFAPQDFYVRNWWQFWVRCKREYLQTLLNRSKWKKHERNLSLGDIVLVKEDDADRKDRSLAGKITEVTWNWDGKVRRAEVISWKAGSMKTYDRPISSWLNTILMRTRISIKNSSFRQLIYCSFFSQLTVS